MPGLPGGGRYQPIGGTGFPADMSGRNCRGRGRPPYLNNQVHSPQKRGLPVRLRRSGDFYHVFGVPAKAKSTGGNETRRPLQKKGGHSGPPLPAGSISLKPATQSISSRLTAGPAPPWETPVKRNCSGARLGSAIHQSNISTGPMPGTINSDINKFIGKEGSGDLLVT